MPHQTISALIQNQRNYFRSGITKELAFRLGSLKKLQHALINNEQAIIDALKKDLNRPGNETYVIEIYICLEEIHYFLKSLSKLCKPKRVKTPLILFPASSYIVSEPYGVALIMAPWNYPVQLCFMPLIGAIAAGNCALIKPSEFAPASSTIIAKIIQETFDPYHVSVLEGDKEIAQELLTHQFDYIFFTGSPRVGKLVLQAAAQHMTPATLELGGKNPCIVEKDASIDIAAKRIVFGKFTNAGQSCIAPDYVLVHESVHKQLVDALKKYIAQFYGTEDQKKSAYARIINETHFQRLLALLKNCTISEGGMHDSITRYISPTIIEHVTFDHPSMQEEIFGPILPIIPYKNLDDILARITKQPKPLTLYIFSNDKNIQDKVRKQTSSGSLGINEVAVQVMNPNLPFGGVGNSGMGNYHGIESFKTFSHRKSVLHNSSWLDIPFRYPPYGKINNWLRKWLAWRVK